MINAQTLGSIKKINFKLSAEFQKIYFHEDLFFYMLKKNDTLVEQRKLRS